MKKALLSLALVGALVCGTTSAFAAAPKKTAVKTEQTATVKKAAAKDAKCATKCDKKCDKKCGKKCDKKCTKPGVGKCAKKAACAKKAPAKAAPAKK